MSNIAEVRAEALNSSVYQEAERHARRLGRVATDASCKSWKHDDAMRRLRHAQAEWEIKEALARLTALNASYRDAAPPTLKSRIGRGLLSTAASMAGGALAVLALIGLSQGLHSIEPPFGAPYVYREVFEEPPFDPEKLLWLIGGQAALAKCIASPPAAQPVVSFGGEQSIAGPTEASATVGH